ncbi:hypothetical protein [Pectobacterium versatile]|uniref:hypothetical protein n=1 Tax=Pectobacterium versatile TaxID=2488639 RepID=UPI001F41079E|nr:hypothetical protein [Pectobacterium versatile]
MYQINYKDRGSTVFIYLDFVKDTMLMDRIQAGRLLGNLAYSYGYRDKNNDIYVNTMLSWGRKKTPIPCWAIATIWSFLEKNDKRPESSREWAWWAYTCANHDKFKQNSLYINDIEGKRWFNIASKYNEFLDEVRVNIHLQHAEPYTLLERPDLALRIFIFLKVFKEEEFTCEEIAMSISKGKSASYTRCIEETLMDMVGIYIIVLYNGRFKYQ